MDFNPTDFLLEVVIALIVALAALVIWVFNTHLRRVDKKFSENKLEHSEIRDQISGTKVAAVRTEMKIDHIIANHHPKMPPYNDDH